MHLTAFSDYTLRTLIYLALRPDTLCTIEEIAKAYDISTNHLNKVAHQAALFAQAAGGWHVVASWPYAPVPRGARWSQVLSPGPLCLPR